MFQSTTGWLEESLSFSALKWCFQAVHAPLHRASTGTKQLMKSLAFCNSIIAIAPCYFHFLLGYTMLQQGFWLSPDKFHGAQIFSHLLKSGETLTTIDKLWVIPWISILIDKLWAFEVFHDQPGSLLRLWRSSGDFKGTSMVSWKIELRRELGAVGGPRFHHDDLIRSIYILNRL